MAAQPATPIRAVFFDLVGTLVRVRGSVGEQYARLANDFGLTIDADAVDGTFPEVLAKAPEVECARRPPGEIAALERAMWQAIVREVFERSGAPATASNAAFDRYFDALFAYFATAAPWALYPDALPALDRARTAGLRLGLITNFDHRVFGVLESLGLREWFSVVAIPGVAGASKPAAGIFRYALAAAGVEADAALHVGDSEMEDARAAAAAGLRAVWLDRRASQAATVDIPRIASLDDLSW